MTKRKINFGRGVRGKSVVNMLVPKKSPRTKTWDLETGFWNGCRTTLHNLAKT